MKWQSPVTLAAVLLVAGCQGAPQHILPAAPQVVYQPLPQHRQSANVVIVPGNTAGIQQFAAAGVPLPVGGQYLLLQPGGPVLYMTRADGGDKPTEGGSGGGGGILTEWFNNILSWAPFGSTTTAKPSEGEATTEGSTNKKPEEKPIKVVEASSGDESKPANLETLDEDVPAQTNPSSVPVLPSPGQRVVVIGQPQFFGSYDALRNPAIQQSLSTNGAVSSFLILKGQQAADSKVQVQEVDLQKYMASLKDAQNVQHQQQPVVASPAAYQNLVYFNRQQAIDDDKASVTVEALGPRPIKTKQGEDNDDNEEGEEGAEDVVADPPGPSVAQVKPQAIALAGPGGVAAAAPLGTALVGPGGLAVAAPSATAVAGPSGGQPPLPGPGALSSPAALKAYILEQQNRGAPVVNPAASYQLAYNY